MNIVHEMKLWRLGIGIYFWPEYQRIDLWQIYLQTISELFANRELFAEHCIMLCISVCSQGALGAAGGTVSLSTTPTLYTVHSKLYTLHCTLYTLQHLHSTLETLHKVQYTLYIVHSTQGTKYTWHSTPRYPLHSTPATPVCFPQTL